ncbi:MAG: shikimate dehydrogenase [Chloroflexota bacterium]
MSRGVGGSTRLVGLIGWPVAHSLSPAMHNAAAAALGLDLLYVPLPVRPADLPAAARGLPALGFLGANVTIPHKQVIMPFLDEIEPAAQAIGAVNTIVVNEQLAMNNEQLTMKNEQLAMNKCQLHGHNTDWAGFLADLHELGVEVAGRECLVLGAGGSARAVVYALLAAGSHVHVLARRPEQAHDLAQSFAPFALTPHSLAELPNVVAVTRPALIVNTTPLGMTPHQDTSPWPADLLFPPSAFVYDLVYNPRETRFLQQAKAAGCRAANGLGMLVQQGALAFQLWTGQQPDTAVMRAAVG